MVRANTRPGTPFGRIYLVSLKVLLVFFALCGLALFVLNTITTHKLRRCTDFDSKNSSGDCIHSSWAPYVALAVTTFLSATCAFAILIYYFHLPEQAKPRMPYDTFRVVTFVVLISVPAFVFGWKKEGIFLKHVKPETSSMTRVTLIFNHINVSGVSLNPRQMTTFTNLH
ncbi:hypothetical protein BGZ61DRAFT_453787 [Ilyonectria robusta]|uniref:uncharacterized protein n=1 Tax=Ilyonectria robusta TaxID=1079257 RepID=UPI001E8E0D85|nr:uncharacterized protein BGZ61DRAFT_453787 [Ilyonectria robusta]KAH8686873.1 hypothetical protein BGZ61DRAFT_453787 [Ilyonectria robusta]